jgi:hypothetical protein
MSNNIIGGTLEIEVNGKQVNAEGDFTINLGRNKNEAVTGPSGMYGFISTPQAPSLKGSIIKSDSTNIVEDILSIKGATIVATDATGKKYLFSDAMYCGDGEISPVEGKVQFEISSMQAEEV